MKEMKEVDDMTTEELEYEMHELHDLLYMAKYLNLCNNFIWNGLNYLDSDRRYNELSQKYYNRVFGECLKKYIKANKECSKQETQQELLKVPSVVETPVEFEPVLAEIEEINDLGKSKWYEVVYFDDIWHSYFGSNTFNDGERVVKWKYCKDCL